MAIYLIVGQPRHGKSQFVVSLAHKIHEKNEKTKKEIDTKGDLSGAYTLVHIIEVEGKINEADI